MNSHDTTPLEPDELDELLSAELDGEFAAAARDLGMSVEVADTRVRATPGSDARRATLTRARDPLSDAPEIDDLLDQRLRAKALRAAAAEQANRDDEHRDRRNRVLLGAAGLAAAIVVALAIAAAVHGSDSSDTAKTASAAGNSSRADAPAAAAAPKPFSGPTRVLGRFTSVGALAEKAVTQAQLEQTKSPAPVGQPTTNAPGAGTAKPEASLPAADADLKGTDDSTFSRAFKSVIQSCRPGVYAPAGAVTTLRATAVLSGHPFLVFVFAGRDGHVVLMMDSSCKVFNRQSLP